MHSSIHALTNSETALIPSDVLPGYPLRPRDSTSHRPSKTSCMGAAISQAATHHNQTVGLRNAANNHRFGIRLLPHFWQKLPCWACACFGCHPATYVKVETPFSNHLRINHIDVKLCGLLEALQITTSAWPSRRAPHCVYVLCC